jgi:DNA-binding GntR family transcriptional regulator
VREWLESESAKRSAQVQLDPGFVVLRHATDGFAAVAKSGRADELAIAKMRSYEALLDGCRSALINEMLDEMLCRISLLRLMSTSQPGRRVTGVAEINEIEDAIRARDTGKAQSSTAQHARSAAALAVLLFIRTTEGRDR